jgi:hypothetical protein
MMVGFELIDSRPVIGDQAAVAWQDQVYIQLAYSIETIEEVL